MYLKTDGINWTQFCWVNSPMLALHETILRVYGLNSDKNIGLGIGNDSKVLELKNR